MKKIAIFGWLTVLLVLTNCGVSSTQIGASPRVCCPGNYENYQTYGLATRNMPLFLQNYVIAEFDAAFQEKGLTRNDRNNDLQVTLQYNHINLDAEQQEIDPFVRMESLSVELTYIAEIQIDMHETGSDELVWSGSLSRIHHVTPGEYMHEERARPAFLQAFRAVLATYPSH